MKVQPTPNALSLDKRALCYTIEHLGNIQSNNPIFAKEMNTLISFLSDQGHKIPSITSIAKTVLVFAKQFVALQVINKVINNSILHKTLNFDDRFTCGSV